MTNPLDSKEELKFIQKSLLPEILDNGSEAYSTVEDVAERIEKGDALNIAVTGPYGSGKSTILRTLENRYDYHYLHISLATLQPFNIDNPNIKEPPHEDANPCKQDLLNEEKARNELIEYSILQQIIYKEKQDTLPYSRMKRIHGYSKKEIQCASSAFIGAFVALIILYEPTWLPIDWIYNILNIVRLNIGVDIISIAYLIWFLYNCIVFLFKQLSHSRLDKVAINKIEVNMNGNESIFNKHLDEILYFFEETDYDVVLIEDLDRFENNGIYLKLRELNNILNESKSVERKIFFVYAVRDDMFKDDERTKCFDYITTVLPVINRSNSQQMLMKELKDRNIDLKDFEADEIDDIAFFLDDMRLLRNIVNEYIQYKKKLGNIPLNSAKLLAMIVYKNYSPKDFADLHKSTGKVYSCFELRNKFVEYKIKSLDRDINNIIGEHKRKAEVSLLNERELRAVYLSKIISHLSDFAGKIEISNNNRSITDFINNEDLFQTLIQQSVIKYAYYNTYYRNNVQYQTDKIDFASIEKEVNPNYTYSQRLSAIKESVNGWEAEIKKIETRKRDIRVQTLSQILNSIDRDSCKEYKDIKLEPRVEFFIIKGYISEDYYDYISYFYESSGAGLNEHDWLFVRDVKLNRQKDYDFHLDNPKGCIKKITASYLKTKAILNIDLLDAYVSDSQTENCKTIIETVINENELGFLNSYHTLGKYPDKVFELLFDQSKSSLWKNFVNSEETIQKRLMIIWLKYGEENYSFEGSKMWIEEHFDFIALHATDIGLSFLGHLIELYQYKFKNIDSSLPSLIPTLASTSSYVLDKNNLTVIIDGVLKRIDSDDHSLSLTKIYETNVDAIEDYVTSSLQVCLDNIFSEPASKNEDSDSIIQILEADNVSEQTKEKYLTNQENKISIDEIDEDDNKRKALELMLVEPTWKEIGQYLGISNNKMTAELADFIKNNIEALSRDTPDSNSQGLYEAIFLSSSLEIYDYEKLMNSFDGYIIEDDFSNLEPERIRLLINHGMIEYSESNTTTINSSFGDDVYALYLIKNKVEFLSDIENVDINNTLALPLLQSSSLDDSERMKVISRITPSNIQQSQPLADVIINIMIRVDEPLKLNIIIAALKGATNNNKKLELICKILKNYSVDNVFIIEMIKSLDISYAQLAISEKYHNLPLSAKDLLDLLYERNIITKPKQVKNKIKVYTRKIPIK